MTRQEKRQEEKLTDVDWHELAGYPVPDVAGVTDTDRVVHFVLNAFGVLVTGHVYRGRGQVTPVRSPSRGPN